MNKRNFGITWIGQKACIPYQYNDGKIKLYLGSNFYVIDEEIYEFIGAPIENLNERILYHLMFSLKDSLNGLTTAENQARLFGNFSFDVDYIIENYRPDCKYYQMRFSFKELDYFLPSFTNGTFDPKAGLCKIENKWDEKLKFNFKYDGKIVSFILRTGADTEIGYKLTSITKSELLLVFDETNDFNFLCGLYSIIHSLFAFICNRKNVSIEKATLYSKYQDIIPQLCQEGEKERTNISIQYLFLNDKYAEEFESDNIISKTINYRLVISHLSELLKLIVEDKISLSGIHSCEKLKNLFDLNQSLSITAAFERHYRTLLPEIASNNTLEFNEEIKGLIQQYADTHTGEKKKKARALINKLGPNISLKEVILKTYKGYEGWIGLNNILDEWYGNKIDLLAEVANDWRNELAHEKNEYEPTRNVIDAIRLVEHLNYSIVLRQAKYSDEEIKRIVSTILTK